jgi:hypothetical protein
LIDGPPAFTFSAIRGKDGRPARDTEVAAKRAPLTNLGRKIQAAGAPPPRPSRKAIARTERFSSADEDGPSVEVERRAVPKRAPESGRKRLSASSEFTDSSEIAPRRSGNQTQGKEELSDPFASEGFSEEEDWDDFLFLSSSEEAVKGEPIPQEKAKPAPVAKKPKAPAPPVRAAPAQRKPSESVAAKAKVPVPRKPLQTPGGAASRPEPAKPAPAAKSAPAAQSRSAPKLAQPKAPAPADDYGSLSDSADLDATSVSGFSGSGASCRSDASWLRPRAIPPPPLMSLSFVSQHSSLQGSLDAPPLAEVEEEKSERSLDQIDSTTLASDDSIGDELA